MPTRHKRIAVTADPELEAALDSVGSFFEGVPAASVVRRLALKGAEVVIEEEAVRKAALERLVKRSTDPDSLDWELLDRIDELAWGYPPAVSPE